MCCFSCIFHLIGVERNIDGGNFYVNQNLTWKSLYVDPLLQDSARSIISAEDLELLFCPQHLEAIIGFNHAFLIDLREKLLSAQGQPWDDSVCISESFVRFGESFIIILISIIIFLSLFVESPGLAILCFLFYIFRPFDASLFPLYLPASCFLSLLAQVRPSKCTLRFGLSFLPFHASRNHDRSRSDGLMSHCLSCVSPVVEIVGIISMSPRSSRNWSRIKHFKISVRQLATILSVRNCLLHHSSFCPSRSEVLHSLLPSRVSHLFLSLFPPLPCCCSCSYSPSVVLHFLSFFGTRSE